MPRDLPYLRVRVADRAGTLKPADAYSEERLMGYQVGREIEIEPKVDLSYWKRRRYFQILSLILKSSDLAQKSVDELHQVLMFACGLTKITVHPNGTEIVYPGSTKELEDPDFDTYYEGAMAWLFEMTGIDPETLEKEVSFEPEHESPAEDGGAPPSPPPAPLSPGDEGGGGTPPQDRAAVADERAMLATAQPMSTAAIKQEAIHKLLALANDVKAMPKPADRLAELKRLRPDWDKYLVGHPGFVQHCFSTAEKVIRGELPYDAAQRFLFSMKDG